MKKQNYLDNIAKQKQREIEQLMRLTQADSHHPLNLALKQNRSSNHSFSSALKSSSLAVICEVKRKSPSRGPIGEIADPVKLATEYCEGGAAAISVLTDSSAFGGSLQDLEQISTKFSTQFPRVPTLRKDFILHPLQLAEAVLAGASAVLLIARLLGNDLKNLLNEAHRLGLETLTETHDVEDLEIALEANAPIIGINHRNLQTFELDLNLSKELRPLIPSLCHHCC